MGWRWLRKIGIWLMAALVAQASPALAQAVPAAPACHASASAGESYTSLARAPARWNCSGTGWSIAGARSVLRWDLPAGAEPQQTLTTRLTRFGKMRLTVIDAEGYSASRTVNQADMQPTTDDWLMVTPLPRLANARTVIAEIEGARHAGMLSDARLAAAGEPGGVTFQDELLIALLCGMLCMPLLFDLAFYRVLQERFLLWHAASTGLMLVHTLMTSGLINRFADVSVHTLSFASPVCFGAGIIAASLFSADLIEPGKLGPIQRRLLQWLSLWIWPWTAFYLFADGPLRALAAPVYLASFLPVMGLFVWTMATAKRRGSRAVNFQIAAWLPLMVTGVVRIASSLGVTVAPIEMLIEQHFAMGFEVIITSLGVFDRLLAVRRERDLALAEMRVFEQRAERDPLTGLFNRRAVEHRFAELYAQGFHAMAAIDLDRFKQVNDGHGHVIGDAVLRAAAAALAPDADTVAVRMGGEEFLLLIRGRDPCGRAERRRQAIPTRIAADVPGLDRIVTASMGLVEQAPDTPLRPDFATLYGHCDRLLYEAKHGGRNRTLREKMQGFARPARPSRPARAA